MSWHNQVCARGTQQTAPRDPRRATSHQPQSQASIYEPPSTTQYQFEIWESNPTKGDFNVILSKTSLLWARDFETKTYRSISRIDISQLFWEEFDGNFWNWWNFLIFFTSLRLEGVLRRGSRGQGCALFAGELWRVVFGRRRSSPHVLHLNIIFATSARSQPSVTWTCMVGKGPFFDNLMLWSTLPNSKISPSATTY